MNETLYTCIYNLRPRVNGNPVLIMAGSSFEKGIIDSYTFEAMLESGAIKEFEPDAGEVIDVKAEEKPEPTPDEPTDEEQIEAIKAKALEQFGVELKTKKLETTQAAYDKLVAENEPKGIFNLKVEDLADKSLDELDAIHADICSDNDLPAPEPFKDVEEAIDKLTSENNES